MAIYDAIPEDLRKLNNWVGVLAGSKVPMNIPTRRACSPSNPDEWVDFDTAVTAVENNLYDQIGFCFHDDGIVGIDIDNGFIGGFLSPTGRDIMEACKSYTEISRSGRGMHIYIRGYIPFKGSNNRKKQEIYRDGRYFVCTGNMYRYDSIVEDQDAIDYVVRKYFPNEHISSTSTGVRVYSPIWKKPENGRVWLNPEYPAIGQGCRNLSLLSLAGQLKAQGLNKGAIYRELLRVNSTKCDPPLPDREVIQICKSIDRYKA